MGLIHSRAAKKRNRAEAALLREQAEQVRRENREERAAEAAELPAWRQPTVGGMLRKISEQKREGERHA